MKKIIIIISITLLFDGAVSYICYGQTEIGGQYRIMANASNFDWHQLIVGKNEKSNSYVNQRFRLNINSKFDKRARAHIQVQFNNGPGGDPWGDGTSPKDRRFALRHAYLDFEAAGFTIRAGIQDWSDGFGDVLASGDWDFNAGGIILTRKVGAIDLRFGTLKLQEGVSRKTDDSNLYIVDANFFWGGFHTYYLHDKSGVNQNETNLWTGVTAKKEIGLAVMNAFIIYNRGTTDIAGTKDLEHSGYAVKIEGKLKLGSTSFGIQTLYSTGDDSKDSRSTNEFRTLQDDGQGYWSYLGLFTPRGSSDVNNLRASLRNRDQHGIARGITTVQAYTSFPILTNKLNGYLAAGLFRSSEKDVGGNNNMGTEFLAEGKYMITESLGIEFGVSYARLGDFYKAVVYIDSPDNIYEYFSRLQVEF